MVAIGISNLGNAIRNRFADSEQGQETAHLEPCSGRRRLPARSTTRKPAELM